MNNIRSAVKALIRLDDKFLVIKQKFQNNFYYDLPGGKVEFGENPYNTLFRECMEELGIEIEIIRPIGLFWFIRHDNIQIVCTTFECNTKNQEINIHNNPTKEKIVEYEFITKEKFSKDKYNVLNKSLKDLIENNL